MNPRSLKRALTVATLIALGATASAVSLASAPPVAGTAPPSADLAALTGTALSGYQSASPTATGAPSLAASAATVAASGAASATSSASATFSPSVTPAPSVSGAVFASANAATGPASTSSSIGLFAYDMGAASSRSSAGWEAAAHNDSLLIGEAGIYSKWIPQLHAWNPKLTILVYNLGPYLAKGSSDFATIEQQDPSWFAHDARGKLINLPMFPGNYLMNTGNAGFRAWHAQQLAATVKADGFDGALDDSMGDAVLGSYGSGTPIDTATGKPYTDAEYLANSVLMLNADKAALAGKYLAFNGLISGSEYMSATSILATSNADAGMSEHFLREPMTSMASFPSTSEVADTLAMMSSLAARGKAFLGFSKVWASASSSQVAKWEQYTLAVYLLGKGSADYLDFMPSKKADNTVVSYSNMQDQLGAPLGAYTTNGSTLSRSFQHGSVSLNTGTDTGTITVT
jgi:hypothetical protein